MPLSAVIDASVLVSAFLFPQGTQGQVVALAEDGSYTLYISPVLLEEVRRSLNNPRLQRYGHTAESVELWCDRLHREIGHMITDPLPDIGQVCRDPDDDHVIAAALVCGAGYIVTSDQDLLTLVRYEAIHIITARTFIDIIAPSQGEG